MKRAKNAVAEQLEERRLLSAAPTVVGAGIVNPANGHTYYLLSSSNWGDAETEAKQLGGHLVTIRSAAENQWIEQNFASAHPVWIGYSDPGAAKHFAWADGETTGFTKWYPTRPYDGQDALMFSSTYGPSTAGTWWDMPPTATTFNGDPIYAVAEVATIGAQPTTVSQTVVSGYQEGAASLSVNLDITDSYDADLTAVLTNPAGASVTLFSNVGADGQNFTDTFLEDSANVPIQQASAPFTGTFSPKQYLNALAGDSVNGTWTLTLTDRATGTVGVLNHWSLSIETPSDGYSNHYIPNGPSSPRADEGTDFGSAAGPVTHYFDVVGAAHGAEVWGGGFPSLDEPSFPQQFTNGQLTSQIPITGLGKSLSGVTLNLNIENDTALGASGYLTSPEGTKIALYSNLPLHPNAFPGSPEISNLFTNTTFADGGTPLTAVPRLGSAPLNGTFAPQTPLSTFVGENPNGLWTLTLNSPLDGTLLNWSLNVNSPTASPPVVVSGADAADFTVTRQPNLPVSPTPRPVPFDDHEFDVTFKPSAPGLRTAWVTVPNIDGSGTNYTFEVQGAGLAAPAVAVAGNRDFSITDYGVPVDRRFTVTNNGLAPLHLSGLSVANVVYNSAADGFGNLPPPPDLGSNFAILSPPAATTLNPGQSTTFQVRFSPTAPGLFNGIVRLKTDDPADPVFDLAVSGHGFAGNWPYPYPSISPGGGVMLTTGDAVLIGPDSPAGGVTAGTAPWAPTAAQNQAAPTITYTVTNTNTDPKEHVRLSLGKPSGNFFIPGPATYDIQPGASVSFVVGMLTANAGPQSGSCTFSTIDEGSGPEAGAVQNFQLNFQGQVNASLGPKISVTSGSAFIRNTGGSSTPPPAGTATDFGSAAVGGSVARLFQVNNVGSQTLTDAIRVGGADPGDFAITLQPPSTVGANGSVPFAVAFRPKAAGVRTAVITVQNSDPTQGTYSFVVSGYGTAPAPPAAPTAAPTFSVASGTYVGPAVNVTLKSATALAKIYYTLNGTTPTTASPLYNPKTPLAVTKSETVKAIAVAPGYAASGVAAAAYTIIPPAQITTLRSGTAVSGLSGSSTSQRLFQIAVPAGKTKLTVAVSGGKGAKLYLRRSLLPSLSAYDGYPLSTGGSETLTLPNRLAATYYLLLSGSFSNVTLKATYA